MKLCPKLVHKRSEAGGLILHFMAVDYVNRLISQVFTFSYRGDIRLADWSHLGKVLIRNTLHEQASHLKSKRCLGLEMERLYIFIKRLESDKVSWFCSFTVIMYYFISQPLMYKIIRAFLFRCCIFLSMTFLFLAVCCSFFKNRNQQ